VNYQETVPHIDDGKQKFENTAKEMAGSGVNLPASR
jgi:hypothetical protein